MARGSCILINYMPRASGGGLRDPGGPERATRPPLAALATDLIASSISRPSASKLSMMDIVDREADAERPRGG